MERRVASFADLIVLMPVYEDWAALDELMRQFRSIRDELPATVHFLLVDDGSLSRPTEPPQTALADGWSLEILRLARNLGHQQAIAVALCYAHERLRADGIIVMDSDGEDSPAAIPRLLQASPANDRVVFASRKRRSEGVVFTLFYHLFRLLHWLLTGISIRVGNFSYLPWGYLNRLVVSSELWNHYAATVFASRVPFDTVPVARAHRLQGVSRMNFPALVSHGLGAISVFSTLVGARMLVLLAALSGIVVLVLAAVVSIRIWTQWAIPGWATYSAGLLLIFLAQLLVVAAAFSLLVLDGRSVTKTIPLRDYRLFLQDLADEGLSRD
jgi:glycosyltransferase involved in cell wall biosynthesis